MTAIEWCHRPGTVARTWNPTKGCSRISEGCRHCYAEAQAARIVRMGKGKPTPYDGLVKTVNGEARWTGAVRLVPETLAQPLSWKQPSTVFVDSMSDLFHESLTNEQIAAVYGVMAACPQHTFIVLTKRARRRREWFRWADKVGGGFDLMRYGPSGLLTCAWEACAGNAWGDDDPPERLGSVPGPDTFGTQWPLPNVWEGVSVENQNAADERIPELLQTPAALRFLSCEPLLGPLDLTDRLGVWTSCPECGRNVSVDEDGCCTGCGRDAVYFGVDWVIAGCESGPGMRPCATSWLASLRDQCAAAEVPFFLKQAHPWTWVDGAKPPGHGKDEGDGAISFGEGSKRKPGGVIGLPYLDGVQWAQFPKVQAELTLSQ